MPIAAGTKVGSYEIVALLGAGGMGEVYRARDSRLNRDVAVKVLSEDSARHPDRLARFKREAQVLASLNHPHIAAIYGFEDAGGVDALVLELVEGPTLADCIAKGALPVHEAVAIARQIAEALASAHAQGIVHRDLKPANIKLRPDGTAKVLDFGLAKLAESSSESRSTAGSDVATTVVTSPTAQGVILGTPSYMSPEQARGRAVDAQTDIWAFGCVVYEMLAGRRAFPGDTASDALARVIEREPEWDALPAATPPRVRDMLRRCLQKDQRSRLHHIADARADLEDAAAPAPAPTRPRWVFAAVCTMVALAAVVAYWWRGGGPPAAAAATPVTILIADIDNRTGDAAFDHTLEPALRLLLEGADFITAYDRVQVTSRLGAPPPQTFDANAARALAVRQGLNAILTGTVEQDGRGYTIAMRVSQALDDSVIYEGRDTASSKDQVLAATTTLVGGARKALGDATGDATQLFARSSTTAASLDLVRYYAAALAANSNNRFEEGRRHAAAAVALDPTFGIGYVVLATSLRALGRIQEAEVQIREALRHLDGMNERERFSTRGAFFMATGDYQQCEKEFGDMMARFGGDVVGHNQRAICLSQLRNLRGAADEVRHAVDIVPKRLVFRDNLALYAAYAGDFPAAEQESRAALEIAGSQSDPYAMLALAFSQTGRGLLADAAATYRQMHRSGGFGASLASTGLADLAAVQGRFSEAIGLFQEGAAQDEAAQSPDRAAMKFAAVARLSVWRNDPEGAGRAAQRALSSNTVQIRFASAQTFLSIGDYDRARPLMAGLAKEVQAEPRAYAKILEGQDRLQRGATREAIALFSEANAILDTWIGHFELARAYVEDGAFAYADSELDRCIARRGEALALFLDEEPTYGLFPPVYYYQGRAREGLGASGFTESYDTYLGLRGSSSEDPLVADTRARLRSKQE